MSTCLELALSLSKGLLRISIYPCLCIHINYIHLFLNPWISAKEGCQNCDWKFAKNEYIIIYPYIPVFSFIYKYDLYLSILTSHPYIHEYLLEIGSQNCDWELAKTSPQANPQILTPTLPPLMVKKERREEGR